LFASKKKKKKLAKTQTFEQGAMFASKKKKKTSQNPKPLRQE
jgi:hypothetical protein